MANISGTMWRYAFWPYEVAVRVALAKKLKIWKNSSKLGQSVLKISAKVGKR